jgi:colanic acid/amylovoran biosynthesis protein
MAEKFPGITRPIVFLGANIDTGNLGCSALTLSLIKLAALVAPKSPICLVYGNRYPDTKTIRLHDQTLIVDVVNYRFSPKSVFGDSLVFVFLGAIAYSMLPVRFFKNWICRLFPILRTFRDAQFIGNINGGDSFSDIYGIPRFIHISLLDIIVFLMKRDLVLLPQTYGPYASAFAKRVAGRLMKKSSGVYARDMESLALVRDLTGRRDELVAFCPDVAFLLDPVPPIAAEVTPALPEKGTATIIGLNVSGLLYIGGYKHKNEFGLASDYPRFIRELIDSLLKNPAHHILLVPHVLGVSEENDVTACRRVFEECKDNYQGRIHLLQGEYNEREVKYVIGQCDFFAGSRMHACIAALSQYIPTIGLAYSKKFAGVFGSVNMGQNVLDMRTTHREQVIAFFHDLIEHREEAVAVLRERIPVIQQSVMNCFRGMALFSSGGN